MERKTKKKLSLAICVLSMIMAGTFIASGSAIAKIADSTTLPDEVKFSSKGEWHLSHPKNTFESMQYDTFLAQVKRGETDIKAHWEYDLLPQTEVVEIDGNVYTVTKPDAQQGKSKLIFDDYEITLGGLVDGSSVEQTKLAYNFEGTLELPAATDTDEWHFEGWFTEPNGQGWQVTNIDENSFVDLDLFAGYSWKNYLIHFDGNGALNTMKDIEVARDANITLPQNAITRSGYVFTGWSLTADGSKGLIKDQQLINLSDPTCKQIADHLANSNDLILYAQWSPITYKLTINTNDNSAEKESYSLAYDQKFDLPISNGIVGYSTVEDGTGKWFKAGSPVSMLSGNNDSEVRLYPQSDTSDLATSIAALESIPNYKLNIEGIGEISFDKFNSFYPIDQKPGSFNFSPVDNNTANVSFSDPVFSTSENSSYESAVIEMKKDNTKIASYTFEWPVASETVSFNEAPQFFVAGQKVIDTSALSFGTLVSEMKTEASQARIQDFLFDENRNGGIYVEVDRIQQQQAELLGEDKSMLMIEDAKDVYDETKIQLESEVVPEQPSIEVTNAVIEEVSKEETPEYIQQSLSSRQMTTFQDADTDSAQKQAVQNSYVEGVSAKQNESNSPDLLNISIAQVKAEDKAVLASSARHIESNATLSVQSVVGEGDAVSPQDLASSEVALDTAQTNNSDLGKLLEGNDVWEIGEAILINNDSNANSNDLQFATVNFTSPVFADTVDKRSVWLDGKLLTEGTDYTIEFYGSDPYGDPTVPIQGNPVQPGTYMYRVIGQGMYTGVYLGKITLSEHSADESSLSQAIILYNSQLNEHPQFFVICRDSAGNSKWLEEGKDYTVVLYDKDPYGDLTVVVPNGIPQHIGTFGYTINGIGEYYGTRSGTIEIGNSSVGTPQLIVPGEGIKPTPGSTAPVNIKSASIQMKKEYTYTGKVIKPAITVKVGNTTLKSNTDYTVAYKNNINASSSAKLIISGKGNYTGTKTITFKIAKAPMKKVTTGAIKTMKYTGKKIEPKVTVKFNGKKVAKNNYTITYSDNVNPGYGKIHIKAKAGKNFYGTKTVKFYIAKSSTKTLKQVSKKKATGKGSNKVSKALSITKEVDIKAQIKRIPKGASSIVKEFKTVEKKVNKVKKPFNSYVSKLKTKIKSSRSDKVQVKLDTKAKTATIVFNQAHFTRNEIKTLTKSDKNGFRSDIGFIIEAFPANDPQRKKGMAGDGFSELLTAKGGAKIGTASAKSFGNKNNARKYYVSVGYIITSCYGKYTVPVNELWSSTEYFGPFTVPEGCKVIFTSKY